MRGANDAFLLLAAGASSVDCEKKFAAMDFQFSSSKTVGFCPGARVVVRRKGRTSKDTVGGKHPSRQKHVNQPY